MTACLLLWPSAARAGSYGPIVYSGGHYTDQGSATQLNDKSAGAGQWGATPPVTYGYDANAHKVVSGTAGCTDAITGTSTWTHAKGQTDATDPPPPVICTEICTATWIWSPQTGTTVTGSATNPYAPSGIHYSTQAGAATVSSSCSPTASVTGTGSANATSLSTANAIVTYQTSLTPVTMSLPGTVSDAKGVLHILIG